MSQSATISENLDRESEYIRIAARSVGRDGEQVRLIVVTKGHPFEIVEQAIEAGATELGENYVEESLPKIARVNPESGLKWHMIGHVQSRKAKPVSENFDWVQTVDSLKLAKRLDRFAKENERQIPFLLECNVSGEGTKFGWTAWNELEWNELAEEISPILELENLNLKGLMTMAPFFNEPNKAQPTFKKLRELRDFMAQKFPGHEWDELSMGMSGDYEVAIQEGATMVRIGTAILGKREKKEGN
ncbi:MAG: YggS family pyridoxal phosphate-dependent enzyme [Anaerolineales bacterium]|nr:YggS family pyridoxal phosphate-dependent enzyme [Anaerolineales bacterium]